VSDCASLGIKLPTELLDLVPEWSIVLQ